MSQADFFFKIKIVFISDCIDCVVDWDSWGECSEGKRSRSQIVVTDVVGAGKACPELGNESEGELGEIPFFSLNCEHFEL